MLKMENCISITYKEKESTVMLLFKPNREYGFYFLREYILLKQFADEVEKVEIINYDGDACANGNGDYGDISGGYLKVYYKDGTSKLIDYCLNDDYDYDFFEV